MTTKATLTVYCNEKGCTAKFAGKEGEVKGKVIPNSRNAGWQFKNAKEQYCPKHAKHAAPKAKTGKKDKKPAKVSKPKVKREATKSPEFPADPG